MEKGIATVKVADPESAHSFRDPNDSLGSSTAKTVAEVGHEKVIVTEVPGKCCAQLECLAGSSIVENAEVKSLKDVLTIKNSETSLLEKSTQALEEANDKLKRAVQTLELPMSNMSAKDAQALSLSLKNAIAFFRPYQQELEKAEVEVKRRFEELRHLSVTIREKDEHIKSLKDHLKVKDNDIALLQKNTLTYQQKFEEAEVEVKRKFEELRRHFSVNVREKDEHIKSLKDHIKMKDNDIALLQNNTLLLEEANVKLEQKVEKIQQQLCKDRAGTDGSYVDGSQTPFLLESAAKDMFSSIATFTSLYSKYMPINGYSPARYFLQNRLNLFNITCPYMTRDHHWILLLKSFICEYLFNNFETETFIPYSTRNDNNVLFLDNEVRVRSCFRYFEESSSSVHGTSNTNSCRWGDVKFVQYATSALAKILPEEFASHSQYYQFTVHGEPQVNLRDWGAHADVLKSFIIAAKKVWDFHKLCLSFEPPARIFRVAVGDPLNEEYMESTVTLEDDDKFVPKVGFMIYPGFRLRKTVIKGEVYLGAN